MSESLEFFKKASGFRTQSMGLFKGEAGLDRYMQITKIISNTLYEDFLFPGIISSIILRSLSIELGMKSIYIFENNSRAEKTHDLWKLFNALSAVSRKAVIEFCESNNINGEKAEAALEKHRDMFETWRYIHDKGASKDNRISITTMESYALHYINRVVIQIAQDKHDNSEFAEIVREESKREIPESEVEEIKKHLLE